MPHHTTSILLEPELSIQIDGDTVWHYGGRVGWKQLIKLLNKKTKKLKCLRLHSILLNNYDKLSKYIRKSLQVSQKRITHSRNFEISTRSKVFLQFKALNLALAIKFRDYFTVCWFIKPRRILLIMSSCNNISFT